MNEKIEKLAEQCGIIGGDIYEDRVVDYEKFAELIVRECLDITSKVRKNPYIPDGDQAGKINREIKKHFGVE